MKWWMRVSIFLTGLALFVFGWHKAHNQMVALQNSGATNTVGSAEVLVMIGGFVMLMSFAPSPETLSRWTSLKREKKAAPAHFKRRRQRN